jgi:hypothetical protein
MSVDQPGLQIPRLSDFWYSLAMIPIISLAKYLIQKATIGFYERNLPAKYIGTIREDKIDKCTKNIFKFFYFSASSLFCYCYVLPDLESFSELLGGNGQFSKVMLDYPYTQRTPAFKFYYLFECAYHIESTVEHLVSRPKNDFYEMICHHFSTVLLIVFSYCSNLTNIGVHVMLIMDNADIPIGVMRAIMDLSGTMGILSVYTVLMSSWCYTRFYVFYHNVLKYSFFYNKGYTNK